MLLVFFLVYRTAEAEWHGVRVYVRVCVCARSLRGCVVLDLCPFGGRKCACAEGVGERWEGEGEEMEE